MSFETFDELVSVIYRPKFDKYASQTIRKEFIEAVAGQVERIQPTETITACKDPKDDKFLEVAVAGKAEVIITGDRLLLVLNPFRKIEILTAGEFLIKYSSK
ncbi:MAG: putative toxin-antitoxin system toxin component, PIN family [Candidatus Kapaibacterium sp.]